TTAAVRPSGGGSRRRDRSHGTLYRTRHPQVAPPRRRPRRRRSVLREASVPARPAWPCPHQGQRIPPAAAGEAEGTLHLRRDGEAVPPLLRRGRAPFG